MAEAVRLFSVSMYHLLNDVAWLGQYLKKTISHPHIDEDILADYPSKARLDSSHTVTATGLMSVDVSQCALCLNFWESKLVSIPSLFRVGTNLRS